ncbi:uncharacterized protein LOC143076929 [Mytilus galloprovincialis]|uniref:uncharacterized protein LOC143076929 n=1 Tax=Mytilus galloprovincialis TaxID=29158 RepID=UPI003F7B6D44
MSYWLRSANMQPQNAVIMDQPIIEEVHVQPENQPPPPVENQPPPPPPVEIQPLVLQDQPPLVPAQPPPVQASASGQGSNRPAPPGFSNSKIMVPTYNDRQPMMPVQRQRPVMSNGPPGSCIGCGHSLTIWNSLLLTYIVLLSMFSVGATTSSPQDVIQRLNYGVVFRPDSKMYLAKEAWLHTQIKKVLAQPFNAYIYVTHQGFATMLSQPANVSKQTVQALAADSDSLYPSLLA